MAITAPQTCHTSVLLPLALASLGISDPLGDGTTAAASAPYSAAQVKAQIYQSDYEIAIRIAENVGHPYRSKFVTEETDFLADGDLVPPHTGEHSRVTIKNGNVSELGVRRGFARIKTIKTAPAIYGSPKNLYAIHAGRIYFAHAGAIGKLDVPRVVKDETSPALLSPVQYQSGVLAHALVNLANVGFPEAHRNHWAAIWRACEQKIDQGALDLPAAEQVERLDA